MSSEPVTDVRSAIVADRLTKEYVIYSQPHHRFFNPILARAGSEKRYGSVVRAVDDVSLTVAEGESLAIIGRNGSGKSTLLEMLTGILEPTSGEVTVRGRVSALLELGAGFNPDFTGRENFRLNAGILGLDEAEIQDIEAAVEDFSELGPFIDEPVRTYSSGMYVRLAFAAAVHSSPEVLVIDEALAVGDIFFQQKCFEFMEKELSDVTKLLVTHDLAQAARIADRCIVMEEGGMIYEGEVLGGIEMFTSRSLGARVGDRLEPRVDEEVEREDEARGQEWTQSDSAVVLDTDLSSSPASFSLDSMTGEVRSPGEDEWKPLHESPWALRTGQILRLRMKGKVGRRIDSPIFGCAFRDRVGNLIFGQNSLGAGIELKSLTPGTVSLEMDLVWPEVAEGEYTATVGLGDGTHELHHHIVAWVQGIAAVTSIPGRPVHGFFNNELLDVKVERGG
jgi:ABC-type polysaccharide/polyol phosphate transport system ATPase subunit